MAAASDHALDTLACMVAAHADPVFRARAALIAECGADDPGMGFGLALDGRPAAAAQWLALAAHWQQFDDGDSAAGCHPGCCVVPAAFAVACATDKSWCEFLDAVWRGYAVTIGLGKLLNSATGPRVFHRTSVAGVFGAATAAAWLERLRDSVRPGDKSASDHLARVLGLAASYACGVVPAYTEPADAEALHPAFAAASGVTAARLVAAGTAGRADALDGPNGLLAALGVSVKEQARDLRTDAITASYLKPHACVRHAHGPMEIVQNLLPALAGQEIEAIEVEVSGAALAFAGARTKTARGAALSIEYAVAAAARWPDASAGPAAFSPPARRELLDSGLIGRVMLRHQPAFDGQAPKRPARVTIRTRSGEHQGSLDDALGDATRPLAGPALASKITALAALVTASGEGQWLLDAVARGERPRALAALLRATIKEGVCA